MLMFPTNTDTFSQTALHTTDCHNSFTLINIRHILTLLYSNHVITQNSADSAQLNISVKVIIEYFKALFKHMVSKLLYRKPYCHVYNAVVL